MHLARKNEYSLMHLSFHFLNHIITSNSAYRGVDDPTTNDDITLEKSLSGDMKIWVRHYHTPLLF